MGAYVLVERLWAVVGEEPGGDSAHVDLFATVGHGAQTANVLVVRGSGTNKLSEGVVVRSNVDIRAITKGLEDRGCKLGGNLDRPAGVPLGHGAHQEKETGQGGIRRIH